ncbi:adenylate/guanylate cyclase domain-containing protein [Ichthyenterobacterium magnum]|uniref:Adenylate cyclase n=1 Tax=Ichthyenterobacterium magnum TaxID=1230530 RepID=A0A420DLX4_9FLAO|nr:adenylate/guanylate cyclase domain-containing protein [Ichthyenterobacterium magnum]RKE95242.1 class 3 adenylate cyclase [Ichthyenterobacterium magnum]
MKRLLICIALIFFNLTYSQVNKDSLLSVWQDEDKTNSIRLNAIDKLMRSYKKTQLDSAFYYAHLKLDLAQKKNIDLEVGRTHSYLGIKYHRNGKSTLGLEHLEKAEEILVPLNHKKALISLYTNFGMVYFDLKEFDKSIDYFTRNFRFDLNDSPEIARKTYTDLSPIYLEIGEYDEAVKCLKKAKALIKDGNKSALLANSGNFGMAYFYLEDYPKSLEYYNEALALAKELNRPFEIAITEVNIAETYFKQEHYAKALAANKRSLKLINDSEFHTVKPYVYNNIGEVYKGMLEYSKSIEAFEVAIKYGTLHSNDFELKRSKRAIYELYKLTGNYNKALKYLEEMVAAKDSLNEINTAKKLQKLEFDKERLKDSLQNEEAKLKTEMVHQAEVRKKDKNKNLALATGLFFLLISGGLYSRYRFTKKAKAVIEKEKDRSENLLLNILPAEVAEELKEKGEAEAQDFEMVSILFSDFKGFTGMSEKMSAKDLVGNINECFKAFDATMEKYNIEKIKTIGDAYMAAGGLPMNSKTSVKDTVLAALDMQDFIIKLHKEKEAKGEHAFEMRVGIHTGPVVAGIVGVKKFQYDIWGDTVNTASRMESSGEVGKVNISENTYDYIKDEPEFTFESRGKIKAKGKGEVEMYFVSLK